MTMNEIEEATDLVLAWAVAIERHENTPISLHPDVMEAYNRIPMWAKTGGVFVRNYTYGPIIKDRDVIRARVVKAWIST